MRIQEIGTRGVIFTFPDNISVYLIKGDQYLILCDTHLGPLSMDRIKDYLLSQSIHKELLIFNSHSDWDHIWGNCAFRDAKIIAHEKARIRMQEIGEFELNHLKRFHNGEITLTFPHITFSDQLKLENEGVEFIYAPGHTIDSSLCFDQRDSILYVGDLVEYPIPYLDDYNLQLYIKTLMYIKAFPATFKLSAHSGIINNKLIDRNISYIQGILDGKPTTPDMIESSSEVHQYNVNNRLLLEVEPLFRVKLGEDFDYASYKSNFIDLDKVNTEDFKAKLKKYTQELF